MKIKDLDSSDDFEISNHKKLDSILVDLCKLVIEGQKKDKERYGMVGACVLDTDNRKVFGLNSPAPDGTRRHAERVAIEKYQSKYGDIPKGSIILTTLSPCSDEMDERYGESCTDVINQSGVRKVYCGYTDPTQDEEQREFNIEETVNSQIREMCKKFADTFLDDVNECAGVGIITKQNSTVDVNKNTPRKNLKAFRLV
jgi:pyrimidine deaminase RibD-like protein